MAPKLKRPDIPREYNLDAQALAERAAIDNRARDMPHEHVDRVLLTMVANVGNARETSRTLRAGGLNVSPDLAHAVTRAHADRYQQLRDEHAPAIEEAIAREAREIALAGARITRTALGRLEAKVIDGRDYNATQVAETASRITAKAIDQLLTISGRPQTIIQHSSVDETLSLFRAKGVLVESTADEEEG